MNQGILSPEWKTFQIRPSIKLDIIRWSNSKHVQKVSKQKFDLCLYLEMFQYFPTIYVSWSWTKKGWTTGTTIRAIIVTSVNTIL